MKGCVVLSGPVLKNVRSGKGRGIVQGGSKSGYAGSGKPTGLAAPMPLVPPVLLAALWFVSLALPNLIYSGVSFADTLHIIKWTVAGVPVAVAALVAGWRLIRHGGARIKLDIDLFGSIWAAMLIYCSAMPLWVDISSVTSLIHEMVCFAAVWVFYVISSASFPFGALRPLLWLANINAAVNVVFAELQIRGLNNFAFLDGTPFAFLRSFSTIILPTPGNYIGNTAQQNMFGLWMAMCVMGSVYLFIAYAVRGDGSKRPLGLTIINVLLMAVNSWGLWNSTSRSGILSLAVGLFVLVLMTVMRFGRAYIKRLAVVLLIFSVVLGVTMSLDKSRSAELINKTGDMIRNAHTMGGRIGIWTTSSTMFKEYPQGVGVGQFKWHYLEAQREGFKANNEPWYIWQYTHWAHNEFLQWFCEAGVIGGLMLTAMFVLWAWAVLRSVFGNEPSADAETSADAPSDATGFPAAAGGSLVQVRRRQLSSEAVWGCALVALITFNAMWTRPFHRIENILWLALAFAITNRQVLTGGLLGFRASLTRRSSQVFGVLLVVCSIAGTVYIGSGIEGNILVRRALSTRNAGVQRTYLERAARHPIVYEEAMRNLGYHYLQVGDQLNDINIMSKGFNILLDHFRREPHSEDMSQLLNWAQRFQAEDVLRELVSYLKPGTYQLVRQRGVKDTSGGEVDALMLLPVHNPGEASEEDAPK